MPINLHTFTLYSSVKWIHIVFSPGGIFLWNDSDRIFLAMAWQQWMMLNAAASFASVFESNSYFCIPLVSSILKMLTLKPQSQINVPCTLLYIYCRQHWKKCHTAEEASTDRQPKRAVLQEGQLLGGPQLPLMSLRGLAKPFRPILKVIKEPVKLGLKVKIFTNWFFTSVWIMVFWFFVSKYIKKTVGVCWKGQCWRRKTFPYSIISSINFYVLFLCFVSK